MSAADWQQQSYQYKDGQYVLVEKVVSTWDRDKDIVTVSTYGLRDGQMVMIKSETEKR